jgi:hypothetical protein
VSAGGTRTAERVAAWAQDPRTVRRLRRAVWVLLAAGIVSLLAEGGNRPADPYLRPARPAPSTVAVPGG